MIGEVGHPPRRIDSERRTVARMAWAKWNVSWNHDATKLAYSRTLDNGLSAVFVWSSDDDRIEQVTPSDVDAQNPAWDADGKRLWFTASDNTPPAQAYLDQTAKMRPPILRRVFWTQAESTGWRHPEALALPSRRYEGVYPQSAPGKLLLVETKLPPGEGTFSMAGSQQVSILDANAPAPKPEVLVEGVEGFYPGDLYEHFTSTLRVSSDANTLLYRKAGEWFVDRLDAGHNVEHRALALTDAKVTVDPRAEWRAMFGDAFRQLAYLLHDPAHPPRDFAAWKAHYEPLVGGIASREDLTYVLEDVLGELHLSHADVAPPQFESPSLRTPTGNLAADFAIDKGRYRIVRVYHAAMFGIGADSVAPLDVPALAAKPGDLVVSIGDRKVSADRDLAEYLQETAGKVTRICLTADGEKAQRCANVTPVANDAALRFAAWLAERQKIVDRLGGGRVGYLHASDTVESGMAEFNRARYAQNDRQGFVLDVRFNSGGFAADYFIQMLTAPLLGRWQMPQGRNATTPGAWLGGPKAMVTNAYCGSGCDTYAYYFGKMGIGPIVGTPTWGGVAGSGGGPMLLDGGWITVPQYAMTDVEGRYALEGQAVQPGIPVDLTLQDMAAGRDPQLERAVLEVEAGIDAKRP
ncbi:S41 family peptidase [Novosphingobium clariflavum]|uniref:S41 family peptidase n=1 Tax=Novosphingobium clariflavum TaxID=2029884 RepID=A0ABV6SER4_9SPHN|nr:S41 family peptidase [Novosphingobium clariflavum]